MEEGEKALGDDEGDEDGGDKEGEEDQDEEMGDLEDVLDDIQAKKGIESVVKLKNKKSFQGFLEVRGDDDKTVGIKGGVESGAEDKGESFPARFQECRKRAKRR